MKATGPGLRELNLIVGIHERTSNRYAEKLGFVFHVVLPNGEYYDNGHQSTWGSYEIEFPKAGITCWDRKTETLPAYEKLNITIHNKN